MNKKSILLPVVISGLMASSSFVMAKPGGSHDFISKLDSNKDGGISSSEFNSNLAGNFSKIDKNGNGTVDLTEFSQHGKERRAAYKAQKEQKRAERKEARFKELDGNSDGAISSKEYVSAAIKKAEERFAKLDGDDQDGKISQQEYSKKRSYGDKRGKPASKMNKKARHPSAEKMFSRMDSNGDGKITREENRSERSKWFKKLDQNGDGLVTPNELKQAREARREK